MNNNIKEEKVSLNRILAFSAPSLPLAALGLPVVIQLPPYYTNYVGLSLAVVGTIFMLARLLDVFIDFGLGILMDKTQTKIGRFTPWLLAGAPIMSIFAYFLFMAKPGASATYLSISLVGTYFAFSICMLAQLGIGASLSHNYYERSRIFGFWQIGNIVGMLLVLAFPVILTKMGGNDAQGVNAMGIIIMVAMPISAIISLAFAKEDSKAKAVQHQGIKDILAALKLKAFKILLGADFIVSFGLGVVGGLFLFFLSTIKGYKSESSLLLLVYFVVGLVCTSIWTFISRKYGKHMSFAIACIYMIIAQIIIILIPKDNFILALIMISAAGVVYAAPILLLRAMVGDVADEDKLINGQDRTGLLFASMTLTSKAGYAFSVGITYLLLDKVGFDPKLGENNTQFAMTGMQIIYFTIPVICHIIVGLLMLRYPLSAERVAEVQQELEKQKNNAI